MTVPCIAAIFWSYLMRLDRNTKFMKLVPSLVLRKEHFASISDNESFPCSEERAESRVLIWFQQKWLSQVPRYRDEKIRFSFINVV